MTANPMNQPTPDDGTCGAKTRPGHPCRNRAGQGTGHLGYGRCKHAERVLYRYTHHGVLIRSAHGQTRPRHRPVRLDRRTTRETVLGQRHHAWPRRMLGVAGRQDRQGIRGVLPHRPPRTGRRARLGVGVRERSCAGRQGHRPSVWEPWMRQPVPSGAVWARRERAAVGEFECGPEHAQDRMRPWPSAVRRQPDRSTQLPQPVASAVAAVPHLREPEEA